ncbi:U1 [Hyposoter didymator ichnovirus]|nr:U1 [Hyposoter didymator ichnovirus]
MKHLSKVNQIMKMQTSRDANKRRDVRCSRSLALSPLLCHSRKRGPLSCVNTLCILHLFSKSCSVKLINFFLFLFQEPLFPSPDDDVDGVYGIPTSVVGWPGRAARSGGPIIPEVAHRIRRSYPSQCPYNYVRISDVCIPESQLEEYGGEYDDYTEQNADGDFGESAAGSEVNNPHTPKELSTSSDSGNASGSDRNQKADGDFGTSTVKSKDHSWGHGGYTNSGDVTKLDTAVTTELSTSSHSGNASGLDRNQKADGDFGTSTVKSKDHSCGHGGYTSSDDVTKLDTAATTELSTSSDSGNASGSGRKQKADGDFGTSTVKSKDHSWGHGGYMSSDDVTELDTAATTELSTSSDSENASSSDRKQKADGDFETSTVKSKDHSWGYGGYTSSDDVTELDTAATTELSTSSDSENASSSDRKQKAYGDFETSTVKSKDHSWGYGGYTSSDDVTELDTVATAELSTSSDSENASSSDRKQKADGDFETPTVKSEDHSWGYGGYTSFDDVTELDTAATTELSTSSDSENASSSDRKQKAYGDFETSTVKSKDHSSGYGGYTSSDDVTELDTAATTELSTFSDSENASSSDRKQKADGDFETSTVKSKDYSWSYGGYMNSDDVSELDTAATTELSTSSDSGNASGSDRKQKADGDFETSTVKSKDHSWGYGGYTSSDDVTELDTAATTELSTFSDSENASSSDRKQKADGDFETSTVKSKDYSWSYGGYMNSDDVSELDTAVTTELSTSSDSGNASGSDRKQKADGDFETSTVKSKDHSWGYGGYTSSDDVTELDTAATTELSTSSDSENASSSDRKQKADGDFETPTVKSEDHSWGYGGYTSFDDVTELDTATTTELSTSSDSENASSSDRKQKAYGDFETSTVKSKDHSSGYGGYTSSDDVTELDTAATTELSTFSDSENASSSDRKQKADGDFETSTVKSKDYSWSYGGYMNSDDVSELDTAATTELSTSSDSGNVSNSDRKQKADGDFETSTVRSKDHPLGYGGYTSPDYVTELGTATTTELSPSSDFGTAGLVFILLISILTALNCICIGTLFVICVPKKNEIINHEMEMEFLQAPHVWVK